MKHTSRISERKMCVFGCISDASSSVSGIENEKGMGIKILFLFSIPFLLSE